MSEIEIFGREGGLFGLKAMVAYSRWADMDKQTTVALGGK
jgi:hypothetical protein